MTRIVDPRYGRICISPRATIRNIVAVDAGDKVVALVTAAAVLGVIGFAARGPSTAFTIGANPISSVPPMRWYALALTGAVLAPFLALLMLYIEGAMLRWSGSLLGGTANPAGVRAAIGWSKVPAIGGSLIYLAVLALGFHPPQAATPIGHLLSMVFWFGGLFTILALWEFAVLIGTLAEVHRFSISRAIGAALIAIFACIGAAAACAYLVTLVGVAFYTA